MVEGERSKQLDEFKEKAGLPKLRELMSELPLEKASDVERRVKLMKEYAIAQRALVETIHATGWQAANALQAIVDLQGKLWEQEESFKKRQELLGEELKRLEERVSTDLDPEEREALQREIFQVKQGLAKTVLDDPSYMRAREQLAREVQFVQKQGLDAAKFQVDLLRAKEKRDDDDLFTVEGEVV